MTEYLKTRSRKKMIKDYEDRMIRKHNTSLTDDNVVCENDLDSKLSDVSKVIYTRESRTSSNTTSSSDSTSLSSQSSVTAASSYHSVPHYTTDNSDTYHEEI